MHINKCRLHSPIFIPYDGYVVVNDDVLPYIFLVDLQDIYSIRIHLLILEYFLQKSSASHDAVQRSNEIVLSITFLRLRHFQIALEGLGKREFPVLVDISEPHPSNILSNSQPSLLAFEERGVNRRKDLIFVFVRTGYFCLLRGVVVNRTRKPVSPCVVASGLCLQFAENRLVFLLYNLIRIIFICDLLAFVAILA